jgi:hypothetical protein
MSDIKVYDIERECGLEDQIRSQASVAFSAPVAGNFDSLKAKNLANASESILEITSAAVNDPDLYNVFSILVSTSWNRNDDIFDKEEVWAARQTPVFKPTNLEHDEKQMVGNIVSCWPVDDSFELIPDDAEASELPENFHLLVSSVIFKQWQDPELRARAEKLISEIEDGDKFVSMECIFRGFDYGVVDPNGNNHVVARNADTAFLTQHLRSYGGAGVYQNHKLGRVLKNITFSGKGFVNKPANPESIIFDKDHIFSFASAKKSKSLFLNDNGVSNNVEKQLYFEVNASDMKIQENDKMSDNQFLNDQVQDLKKALASVQEENKNLNEKLAEANVSAFETKIQELESTVAELEAKSSESQSQLEESIAKCESLETELADKTEAMKKLEGDMHKMEEDKKKKDRKVMMVKAGLSEEEAEAKLEVFADVADEAFEAFVQTVADMHEKKKKEDKEKAMKEYGMKEKASEEVSETEASEEEEVEETEASELVEEDSVDTSEIAMSSEQEDELSTARASLQEWVESNIMK